MFWERFTEECALKGVKPNQIADEIGVSSGTLTKWKKGALPNVDKLIAVSSYFGVTTDYLLGLSEKITLRERIFPEITMALQKRSHNSENLNIPEFDQALLFFFENCDAPGQLRIIQCAMNEHDRTQREKNKSAARLCYWLKSSTCLNGERRYENHEISY